MADFLGFTLLAFIFVLLSIKNNLRLRLPCLYRHVNKIFVQPAPDFVTMWQLSLQKLVHIFILMMWQTVILTVVSVSIQDNYILNQ